MTSDGEGRCLLSTGKAFTVNLGIIGLSPSLELSEGYDAGLWSRYQGFEDEDSFSREELAEIADHMIERWQRFRESVQVLSLATPGVADSAHCSPASFPPQRLC